VVTGEPFTEVPERQELLDAVIGLGSNLDDPGALLVRAVAELGALGSVTGVSSLYETDPVGPPQPAYLNAAVRMDFRGAPRSLLGALLAIEQRHGRIRRERNGPRTLDLDILWISGKSVADPDLVVPHPRLAERRFALIPLLDVAPAAVDPVSREPLARWLERLPEGGIRRISSHWSAV
jgi:2-amino-4-hydroxy-6-hydroxymethyldihydropteridine diphosphokinase